jgi:hypothetical protein
VLAGFGRLLLDAFGLARGSVRALVGRHVTRVRQAACQSSERLAGRP